MKKRIAIIWLPVLCLGLTGCSAGSGTTGWVMVALGLLLAPLAMIRSRSLARIGRSRRLTKKQRQWLYRQSMLTDLLSILAAALLVAGIILGLASCGGSEETPHQTDPALGSETAAPTLGSEPTEETGPDLTGIPDSLLELMEKNPETTDFVLNYVNHQPMEIDLSEIDRSAGVPLFLQWDPRWGYEIYGSDVLAITGCAPTCLAMVGFYLTGDERFTPDQMAIFSAEDGHYASGSGTNWTLISQGSQKLGLSATELPLAESVIVRNLEAGNPIIFNVGPGDFTTSGHYMVMVGYENGMIRINDPNSRIKSEQLWSYETLAPQIRNLWAMKVA